MFMDALASFVVFAIIVALAVFSPAPLDQKADPTQKFIAYPAWYFLALYGLLRLAGQTPAAIQPIANLLATVVIPTLAVVVLILLPFLDRNPSRQLSRRPWVLGLTALSLVAAIGLSLFSQLAIQQEQAEAGEGGAAASAATASNSLGAGTSAGASSTVAQSATGASGTAGKGGQVFAQNCASCHQANGQGQAGVFPALAGNKDVTGPAKLIIHTLLYGLQGKAIDGKSYGAQMPAWKGTLTNADIAAVATYIRSSWGNKASAVTEADVAKVTK
jgi:mono/diheme cytochrome c family protein